MCLKLRAEPNLLGDVEQADRDRGTSSHDLRLCCRSDGTISDGITYAAGRCGRGRAINRREEMGDFSLSRCCPAFFTQILNHEPKALIEGKLFEHLLPVAGR